MPNAVYHMTLQALSQSVSDRAAEALLTASLRERHLTPEDVTAQEMQAILSGPLIHRLNTILTPARARAELGALSKQLEREYPKAPTLFTDIGAFTNWDEVEPVVSDWHGAGDLSGASDSGGGHSGAADSGRGSHVFGAREASMNDPIWRTGTPQAAENLGQGGSGDIGADDFGADDFGAEDFEFDDPEYAAPLQGRRYALERTDEQDALIRDLSKMQGVLGVLVTRGAGGEVLRVKAMRDTSRLSSVIAATALLLRQRGLKLMSADLGGQIICMRPLGEYCVTVMAGPQVNIGRLLAELQQISGGDAP